MHSDAEDFVEPVGDVIVHHQARLLIEVGPLGVRGTPGTPGDVERGEQRVVPGRSRHRPNIRARNALRVTKSRKTLAAGTAASYDRTDFTTDRVAT
jgi:hypothetical protein